MSKKCLGITLTLLFFAAVLQNPKIGGIKIKLGLFLLAICIVFAHKLTAVFFLFIWIFFLLHDGAFRHCRYLDIICIFIVLAALQGQFFTGWYDAIKQEDFWRHLRSYYPNYWELPSNAKFIYKMGKYYYFLPIGFLSVVALYGVAIFRMGWIQHPFLKLGLMLSCAFCYIFMIHVSSPNTAFRFYAEINYLPLSLLFTIPLLFDFLPKIPSEKMYWVLGGLAIIVFLRINVIYHNHNYFTNRLDWFNAQLAQCEQFNTNRLILNANETDKKDYTMAWSSPYESILLSSLNETKESKTLLISNDKKHYAEHLQDKTVFLTWFEQTPVNQLNNTYFQLSNNSYYVINPR